MSWEPILGSVKRRVHRLYIYILNMSILYFHFSISLQYIITFYIDLVNTYIYRSAAVAVSHLYSGDLIPLPSILVS